MMARLGDLIRKLSGVSSSAKPGPETSSTLATQEASSLSALENRRTNAALEALKTRGAMPLEVWCDLVEEAIRLTCPPDSAIPQRVKALQPQLSKTNSTVAGDAEVKGDGTKRPSDSERVELYRGYIDAVQKLREFRQDKQSLTSLERDVIAIIDEKLFETRTAKFIRLAVPFVFVLVVGGVIWGGIEVRGALKTVQDQFTTMKEEVERSRTSALTQITALIREVEASRTSATTQISTALGTKNEETQRGRSATAHRPVRIPTHLRRRGVRLYFSVPVERYRYPLRV